MSDPIFDEHMLSRFDDYKILSKGGEMSKSTKELKKALLLWRDTLKDLNRASESDDYWNEEENGDETNYKAIRAAIKQGKPKVSREFVEGWAHILAPINPETYMGSLEQTQKIRVKYIRRLLREAGVEVEEAADD